MLRVRALGVVFLSSSLLLTLAGRAADWPQWRGPQRTGISTESNWVAQWPETGPKEAWKAQVGQGYASFVVAQGRVFTTGHAQGQDTVFCLDAATGKTLWKHAYPAELGDKYFDGGTTGTPTVEGNRVYTLSRWGDAFCFNAADGTVVWATQIQKAVGARVPDWGFGGAPLIHGKLVILNAGEAGLALDRETGAVVWKSGTDTAGYSTPLPLSGAGEPLAILGHEKGYVAIQLKDGKPVWNLRWLTQYGVNAPDPIVSGNRMWISTGYGKGAALFELGAGEPKMLFKTKSLRTQMNAAVLFEGHLYGVDGDTTEKASLKCVEFATGTEKWSQPDFGSGSVLVAGGRLVALSGTGELMVAPASPEAFKPTARAQVLGGKTWTVPVLSDGRLICRNSRGDVVCLDLRQP